MLNLAIIYDLLISIMASGNSFVNFILSSIAYVGEAVIPRWRMPS
jgi:hypothetical protein